MNEIVECKVRDIKDASGRWEIRLERRILPPVLKKLAFNQIKLKFGEHIFGAYTGIAAKDKLSQYFWINTHEDEAGPIKGILEAHGYKPNDNIELSLDEVKQIAYVIPRRVCEEFRQQQPGHKNHSTTQLKLNDPQTSKLHNIIDMGLEFSAMIRLFSKGSKKKLRDRLLSEIPALFEAESEKQFNEIHANFCNWGTQSVILAEREKDGRVVKEAGPASYGQIAKILDVVLKVIIYYCHLPNRKKSDSISKWLHAAADNKMMAYLRKYYPDAIRPWPVTIEQVNNLTYMEIQNTVKRFIHKRHSDRITPVQFDDIYWEALNRQAIKGQ